MEKLNTVKEYLDKYPCGVQITDEEYGSPQFFDEIKKKFSHSYNAYAHSDELLNFQAYRGKTVLEVGCGIGLDALEFARNGARVTAIDLSPKNIELAKKYFSYHNLDASIEVGNAEQMRFDDDTFDLVVAIGVLYYTPNTQKAVDEILRVLKSGGKAICMFFNKYSWYVLLARISNTNLDHEEEDPPIIKLYSIFDIKKMFSSFSSLNIVTNRFPTKTIKRSGRRAQLYNNVFTPLFDFIPKALIKPFGFHIIVDAIK